MRKASLVITMIMLTSMFLAYLTALPEAGATVRFVGGGGPGNYTTIQGAIMGSNPGDTVFVYNGTYRENLIVHKSLDLVGEDRKATLVDGGGTEVINVTSDWVNITGFTITNASSGAGIRLYNNQNCTISDVNLSNLGLGIWFHFSDGNTIVNNSAFNVTYGIYAVGGDQNDISLNTFSWTDTGIYVSGLRYDVFNNSVSHSDYGIKINSHSSTFHGNVVTENREYGIEVWENLNVISNNVVSSNGRGGIDVYQADWNTIDGNTLLGNSLGVIYSEGTVVSGNVLLDNLSSIYVYRSPYSSVVGNMLTDARIIVSGSSEEDWNTHAIDTSNLVNEKPVYYWKNVTSGKIPIGAGQVILANCTGVTVENQDFSNATGGIQLGFSWNNTVANNTAGSILPSAIHLSYSSGNTIINNTVGSNAGSGILVDGDSRYNIIISNNISAPRGIQLNWMSGGLVANNTIDASDTGVLLWPASDILISGNTIMSDRYGITAEYSQNSSIVSNTIVAETHAVGIWQSADSLISYNNVSGSSYGIELGMSDNSVVSYNNLSLNEWVDISLNECMNATVSGNVMVGNGVIVWGASLGGENTHTIDTSNIVNGKPVYYWKNVMGGKIPPGAGQVILANCTDVTIENQDVSNTSGGIRLGFSWNNTIANNTAKWNGFYGVGLWLSDGNTITNNTIAHGRTRGIALSLSSNNTVHHNTFLNNSIQASSSAGINVWDDGYPSGGNYWSDYSGADAYRGPEQNIRGSDGIGDTPHVIDSDNVDRYPLVSPGIAFLRPPENLSAHLTGGNLEHVTITWGPSPDEGLGLIARYDVLRGENYNATANLYTNIGSSPNGTHQFVAAFDGEGNPNTYFFAVCAINMTNDSSCADDQAAKFTRPLAAGPNLIAILLIQSDESIETVLQTVEYDKAWHYDSSSQEWKWYVKSKTYRRGLWNVNHTMGIWVNITQNSNLTVAGVVPAQTTIHLYEGWNLVSFPSVNTSFTVGNLKASLPVERVEGFDLAPPHFLRVLSDSDALLAGRAYWVRVQADVEWNVPFE